MTSLRRSALSRRGLLAGAVGLVPLARHAVAQDTSGYPTRPVRVVLPFPPGGGADVIARSVFEHLSVALGQPFVMDNRGGADGVVGTAIAARAPADGYTLCVGNLGTMAITPNLDTKVPYNPMQDFVGVGMLTTSSTVLVVHPSVPARTLWEFVVLAKTKPGKLNYATSSPATMLPMEMFKLMASIEVEQIPYKGTAAAMNDIIGGHVHAMFGGSLATVPQVKSGRLRALAVAGTVRTPALPDVPTIAESGFPDYSADTWNGVFAPAGTPQTIVDKLNLTIITALATPAIRDQIDRDGAVPGSGSSREFTARVAADHAKWSVMIDRLGLRNKN